MEFNSMKMLTCFRKWKYSFPYHIISRSYLDHKPDITFVNFPVIP
uniref:Uncharacterized protein n=1 Tax=Anguilla anguilla TaxID=7936 RepID=A0A0E9TLI1_ANGAN